jgi:hypothetical protein
MMFETFRGREPIIRLLKNRIPIILFSSTLIVLLLWCGQILVNKLSGPQKEVQEEILRREKALMKKIRIKILDTGYRKNHEGNQEMYMPVLIVEITNISPEIIEHLRLRSYFKNGGKLLCSGECKIEELNSNARTIAVITCSLQAWLEASQWHLDLPRMRIPILFELWLEAPGISMVIENGKVNEELVLDLPAIPEYK